MVIEYIEGSNTFKCLIDGADFTIPYLSLDLFRHQFNSDIADSYQVILFQNPYLCRENDTFQLYFNNSSSRNGWIFPAQLLFSREFESKQNLCDIIRIAQYHLIQKYNRALSEMQFHELPVFLISDLIICVFSKSDAIENNVEDSLVNALPSFAHYGYYLRQEECMSSLPKLYNDGYIKSPNERIIIKSSDNILITEPYIQYLLTNWLPMANQPLQRFVLVYQVLEHCMSLYLHDIIESVTNAFRNNALSKNDFAERIRESGGEQYLITEIFRCCLVENDVSKNFCDFAVKFFELVNIKCTSKDLPHLLYKFRNNIVHNYRNIICERDSFHETLFHFENVILNLILSYKQFSQAY